MQFSHQGVSFSGLTAMGGAGASQALASGWVREEQLKTVLPLCLTCGKLAGESGLCALISPGLCFLGHPCLLFQPCCFCTLEPWMQLVHTLWTPHFLEPQSSSTALPHFSGLLGLLCSPGMCREPRPEWHCHNPACSRKGFGSSACALEPGDGHRL